MPATSAIAAQRRAAYEDWRPPVVGIALLMPVGADCLAVADLRGMLMLPVGDVRVGQSPEEAAQRVLASREGLPSFAELSWIGCRHADGRSSPTCWPPRR